MLLIVADFVGIAAQNLEKNHECGQRVNEEITTGECPKDFFNLSCKTYGRHLCNFRSRISNDAHFLQGMRLDRRNPNKFRYEYWAEISEQKASFAFAQSKRKMRNKVCPVCKEPKGIRKIIWGMPAGEFDECIYYIGGCVSEDFSANYKCIDCGWEGK